MPVRLNDKYLKNFITNEEYLAISSQIKDAHNLLHNASGLGNDFLGWLDLPSSFDKEEFCRIKKAIMRALTCILWEWCFIG